MLEPLARGGFGAVYVAEQLTTERRVALKMLARYAEDVSVERLLAEARVTSRILSDHIVQVIDAGVDSAAGDVFVVMELLRGSTLDDRVMDHGPIPAPEVAEIMRQIAVGLDKAHGYVDPTGRTTPIIHRDLKPSNIFVTQRDDGRPLLKILDFGAAKVLSQTTKTSGVIRGTPQFMAPEQALGEPSTVETDIWALGLIAFYLLTGRSYWLTVENNGTQTQLFAELLNLPFAGASARARQLGAEAPLPATFDAWFSRCVNRDHAQRFPNAGLAAAELSRALGVPVEPRRVTTPPPPTALTSVPARTADERQLETQKVAVLSSTPGPNRARVGLAALGVVLAGAAAIVLTKQASRTDATPAPLSAAPAVTATPAPAAEISAAPPPPSAAASSSAPRSKPLIRKNNSPARPSAPPAAARDPYEQR